MIHKNKIILAVETSCDETSAAIIEGDGKNLVHVRSNIIASQIKVHNQYGGIFPDLAAGEHTKKIIPVIMSALHEGSLVSKPTLRGRPIQQAIAKLDALAVTIGPGLIGSLLVGTNAAATLAMLADKPIIPINHWEGHLYSVFLRKTLNVKCQISNIKKEKASSLARILPEFPLLILTVSGGHTMLVLMKDHFKYQILGSTIDDAAGEAFDKTARMLGLEFPGGPAISRLASIAREQKLKSHFILPRPMIHSKNLNFSFSGLKTAVLYALKRGDFRIKRPQDLAMAAREIEEAIVETLVTKLIKAIKQYRPQSVAITGGVSANRYLRESATSRIKNQESRIKNLYLPDLSYTTDNAAMIGAAAIFHLAYNKDVKTHHGIEANASLRLI